MTPDDRYPLSTQSLYLFQTLLIFHSFCERFPPPAMNILIRATPLSPKHYKSYCNVYCSFKNSPLTQYSGARKSNISLPNAISCQGPQIHNLISSGTLISLLAPPLLPVFTVFLCRQRHHQHNLFCPNITTLLVN